MDFNKYVKLIIEPVLLSFGFTIKQDIKGIVKYDYSILQIILSYDYNSSYEVEVTLLFKQSGAFYGYNELRQYFGNGRFNLSAIQIKDENAMIKWLEEVVNFLKDNLRNIIDNWEKVQIGMERIRRCQINDYESERNNRLLNEGVEKYWVAKDYRGLVDFLKNKEGLAGSVKKKYEFALKMIK